MCLFTDLLPHVKVIGAFDTPLMASAQATFEKSVTFEQSIKDASHAFKLSKENVTGGAVYGAIAANSVALLSKHMDMVSSIKWIDQIRAMHCDGCASPALHPQPSPTTFAHTTTFTPSIALAHRGCVSPPRHSFALPTCPLTLPFPNLFLP